MINQTDDKIREEILRRFSADRYLKEHELNAIVNQGIVTLQGTLYSPMAKELAQNTIADIPGIVEVHDEITVSTTPLPVEGTEAASLPSISDLRNSGALDVEKVPGETVEDAISREDYNLAPAPNEEVEVPDPTVAERAIPTGGLQSDQVRVPSQEIEEDSLQNLLTKGMNVLDRDGKKVGHVKEIRSTDFLLSRPLLSRDLYVPYDFCTVNGQDVVLSITSNEIGEQGWATPRESLP